MQACQSGFFHLHVGLKRLDEPHGDGTEDRSEDLARAPKPQTMFSLGATNGEGHLEDGVFHTNHCSKCGVELRGEAYELGLDFLLQTLCLLGTLDATAQVVACAHGALMAGVLGNDDVSHSGDPPSMSHLFGQ